MTEHYRYYTNPNGFGNIVQKTNKQTGEINLEGETCPLRLLPPAYIPVILTITDGKIRKFTKYEKIPNSTQTMAVDYFYDALGRRIAKKVKTPSREFTQTYSYLANEDKILFAKKGSGEVQMEIDGQGIDEHLGEITIAGIKTFASDHLGTVINGEIVGGKKATGAFGEILSNLNQIETTSNPTLYGYTGRQLDQESGIYYYRNRYYDSQSGRFLSKDPKGIDGGDVNLYRYVQNAPIILTDPTGENPAAILLFVLDAARRILGLTPTSVATGKVGGSDLNSGEDKALAELRGQQSLERAGFDKLPSLPVSNRSIELNTSNYSGPQLKQGGACP